MERLPEQQIHGPVIIDDRKALGVQLPQHDQLVESLWSNAAPDAKIPVSTITYADLWLLTRRFNKSIQHLKLAGEIDGGLDGNVAGFETYSPEKLRGVVERFYITVIVSLVAGRKHLSRLRSWRETTRTSIFCAVYFTAWGLDLLLPALVGFLICCAVSPKILRMAFPHVPMAIVSTDGGLQQSAVGGIGSESNITGTGEQIKGEALEAEAAHFVTGVASITLACLAVPNPTAAAHAWSKANIKASGEDVLDAHNEAQAPMEALMWDQMHFVMRAISDCSDLWERFANAVSPIDPFDDKVAGSPLIGFLGSLFAITLLTSPYVFWKVAGFAVGVGLFGNPIWKAYLKLVDPAKAYWYRLTRLQNTILRGIPTNQQLTLALLRAGERIGSPLPPPPRTGDQRLSEPRTQSIDEYLEEQGSELDLQPTEEELDSFDPIEIQKSDVDLLDDSASTTEACHDHKGARALAKIFKKTAKVGAKALLVVDKAAAKVGSSAAKERTSHTPIAKSKAAEAIGPWMFAAKYDGVTGYLCIQKDIHSGAVFLTFSLNPLPAQDSTDYSFDLTQSDSREISIKVEVSTIVELKRVSGYGWKSKVAFSWLLDERIMDALLVKDDNGKEWLFTAMPQRNEVFNRLASIGPQKWAVW